MIYKFSVIIFFGLIGFIQATDDRNSYTVVSADGYDMKGDNEEEVQFANLGGDDDKVQLKLYYECMCPFCRNFDVIHFAPTVAKLSPYLDVKVYPYGNAETEVVDGKYVITCQHGPPECYGNMLHACAIDQLKNLTQAILYNTCLMARDFPNSQGSDDKAASECGADMKIDAKSIIACAKSDKGLKLLNYYGELTKKVTFKGVPYILINGKQYTGEGSFFEAVCAVYKNPPPTCNEL